GEFLQAIRLVEVRQRQPEDECGSRKQEKHNSNNLNVNLSARGKAHGQNVDPHVLIAQERIPGGKKKYGTKQVPLQFEPCIRTGVKNLANDGIAGADEHHD